MIQQGHKYDFKGREVIACEPSKLAGAFWWVRPICGDWLGERIASPPDFLKPLPMKYFHGQIPK